MLIILLIGIFSPIAFSQTSLSSCNRRWQTQFRCLEQVADSHDSDDPVWPTPERRDQNRIRNDVNSCFRQARCRLSPFPTDQEMNARRQCYKDALNQVNRDVDSCMRDSTKVRNWDNPIDNWPEEDMDVWQYTNKRVYDSLRDPRLYCDSNVRKQDLQNCVRDRVTDFNFDRAPPVGKQDPAYWCKADAQCWYELGPDCQKMWDNQVIPELCRCSRQLTSRGYLRQAQDSYNQCISRRVRNRSQLPNDDPGPGWLAEYVGNMCAKGLGRPCQKQRRDYERDNRNGNNRNGNNWG